MVTGIVLFALGVKKVLEDPADPLKDMPAVALCGGLALYALGMVAFRLRNTRTLARARIVAAAACLALIPVAMEASALVALALLAAVWIALIVPAAACLALIPVAVEASALIALALPAAVWFALMAYETLRYREYHARVHYGHAASHSAARPEPRRMAPENVA